MNYPLGADKFDVTLNNQNLMEVYQKADASNQLISDKSSNEVVIGAGGVGNGTNTVTVGNATTIETYIKGTARLNNVNAGELTSTRTYATMPTPTNITTVTVNKATRMCQIVQLEIRGTTSLTSGTTYTIETLPLGYRPLADFEKNILLSDASAVSAHLKITSAGVITIIPRTTITSVAISIFEVFFGTGG